jgi:hypothetical protein
MWDGKKEIAMRYTSLTKFCLALMMLSLIGCGSNGSVSSVKTGSIAAQVEWSQTVGSSSVKHVTSVPSGVTTVRIVVSGPGISDIQKDFPAAAGEGQIDGVPVGNSLTLTAMGLDANGFPTFEGLKGQITVTGGQTTDVGTVVLSPSCISLVDQGDLASAKDTCVDTADTYGDATSNLADGARFLSAFSRISALWFNMQSDGNPDNGLNSLGDILDAFGCDTTGRDPLMPDNSLVCPTVLPANAPTGADLQTFIADVIKPQLEGAITDLGKISQSFNNFTWKEPFGGKQVISDYGDVLALKGGAELFLSLAIVQGSYNLDADIVGAAGQTTQTFLASNPNFLHLSDTSGLSGAHALLVDAADDAVSAINKMQARTDAQGNHLIGLGNMTATQINNTIDRINLLKSTGPTTVPDDHGVAVGTINLDKFFVGIDLRNYLPAYAGNIPGFFADPTFNGIWTNYATGSSEDPNHDFNSDGAPDLLEKIHN